MSPPVFRTVLEGIRVIGSIVGTRAAALTLGPGGRDLRP
ncbi:hypothetical protein BJ971_003511 [Actinoplanes digitatis]|uniref:Uncharacterized protein n=1 Tax=Actinoplanes digitatis TaxID=1868 RepID=A0A7W7HY80_9ACTN|nr:hypothetical protein [Actinoplanes digitatis]